MKKLKISQKIMLILSIVLLSFIGSSIYSIVQVQKMRVIQDEGSIRANQAIRVSEGVGMADKIYAVIADAVINRNIKASEGEWALMTKELDEDFAALKEIVDTDNERDWLKEATVYKNELVSVFEKEMLPLLKQEDNMENRILVTQLDAKIDKINSAFEEPLIKIQNSILNDNKAGDVLFDDTSLAVKNVLIIVCIIILFISIALTIWISRNIQNIIKSVINQTKDLVGAAVAGKLATRAKPEDTNEEFREIVVGINNTLDAVIGPLNVAAEYVDRIAKGNIPARITDTYNGDFNEIKNNLNACIDAVNLLVTDAGILAKAAVEGKLATRADATKHQGDFRKIVQGVNETLDAVIGPLNVAAEYVDRISKGNIPSKITDNYNGDFNEIKNNLNVCIDSVNALVTDAGMLAQAAIEGRLATRADATKHQGDFQKIVHGVNETLDAVIGPLNVAADYVDRISKGNIPVRITDNYNGDFNTIKNNLNNCIDNINALVIDANMLEKAAIEGKLATRADASKHGGDYRKIVEGVNSTLNAVIDPLNVAADYVDKISKGEIPAKITDKYNGDFNILKNNLNQCIDAVNLLVADANLLAKAAIDGRLATRADAAKHWGDFRKIVEGVNATLDAVIGPLNVAALYVDKIAQGDMPDFITDNYYGDFNNIKNNLNSLIKAFNEIITKAKMVAQGDLTITLAKRSDNDELMAALSDMVARLSEIVGQVMEAAQNVATSSNEMSSSAVQISQGANEQSASAEQVSSSIEEMASTIQQNSDNSVATEKIAVASAQGMMEVNSSAQKSLEAMRKISEKIKVINDIAGKTDILAINAAIEAARAGEQGKGFAVVAAEVRKLAEVSQKAAVEINELSASTLRITEESGNLMVKIIPEIQKTAQLVKEIAASSHEQRSGSDQITKAVIQFTQVTQQNAAAAEEMSSSSEELASQAEQLKETISFFNTGRKLNMSQPVKPAHKSAKRQGFAAKEEKHTGKTSGINIEMDKIEQSDNLFESF